MHLYTFNRSTHELKNKQANTLTLLPGWETTGSLLVATCSRWKKSLHMRSTKWKKKNSAIYNKHKIIDKFLKMALKTSLLTQTYVLSHL